MRSRAGGLIGLLLAVLVSGGCALPPETGAAPTAHPIRAANPDAMAAREALKPNPDFDFGQTVQITPSGFMPADLVGECCKPLVWKNLSGAPVTIVFDHQQVNSGAIAPNGTFVYKPPNVESVVYHSQEHPDWPHGHIQVNQMFESLNYGSFTVS